MTNQKYIALIDCDSFFVSCERKLNPELKGVPVAVVSGERGCVISRSKEAKMLGLPMGLPLFQAVQRVPECIYISANHYAYTKISKQVMNILKDFSPNVEVYSIDEAFVDFTGLTKLYKKNYFKLARELQKRIADEVDIPVTIGISRSKTLAKLASDKAKNTSARIAVIGKCGIHHLLEFTEIQEVWGIGRKLGVRLRGLGVRTALDFINKDDKWVKSKFGKNGLTSKAELSGVMVSPIGVLLKTKDFRTLYSKVQLDIPTDFEFEISRAAFPLLTEMFNSREVYRSVGIVLEDFKEKAEEQLTLFSNNEKKEQNEKLGQSLDKLEKKFGRNIVRTGFTNKEVPFKQGFLTSPKDV